jgi:hypothetical protein
MKKLTLLLSFGLFSFITISVTKNNESHRLSKKELFGLELNLCNEAIAKGKPSKCKLYGKIKYVTSFPDVKVKVVTSFPDIKVKIVSSFANKPGLWKIVNSFPDYKVQKVTSFPDYKIKFVKSFPGCK